MKNNILILIILCFLLTVNLFAKDIVLVHSYSNDLDWTSDLSSGFRNSLGQDYSYHEFFMNTKNIPDSEFQVKANDILQKLLVINPDLVFITDDNALKFVGKSIPDSIPVVFAGINNNIRTSYPWILNQNNVTGILERTMIKRTIVSLLEVFNLSNQKVLLLVGDSNTGQAIYKNDLNSENEFTISTEKVEVFMSGNFSAWKEKILSSEITGYNFIVPVGNHALKNEENENIHINEVLKWISENSPLPTLTIHAGQIGKNKIMAGVVLSGVFMGEDSAKIARKILAENIPVKKIFPIIHDRGVFIISKIELDRWNLNISDKQNHQISFID